MFLTGLTRRIHLAGLAGLVLLAADDGTGGGGTTVQDPPVVDGTGTETNTSEHTGATSKSFSQADVDAIVTKRLKAAQAKFETDIKAMKDRSDLDEVERLKAEMADKDKAIAAAERKALESTLSTTAERLALAAGVNPARVAKFLRTFDLDLDELATDGKIDTDAVKLLVEHELNDSPEFLASTTPPPVNGGAPTGGDFTGANQGGKVWTRAEIAKLTPAEFEEHEAEISKQVAAGTVK